MILNNARQVFAATTTNQERAIKNLAGDTTATYPVVSIWMAMCGTSNEYHRYHEGYSYLEVGFGDTAVTSDDYNLADSNATNPKLTCVASGKNNPNGADLINTFANFRNDGASNVVVKEIGVVGHIASSSSASVSNVALMYRKVLDTPVTIAPGETYNFNYRIRIR